MARRSKYTKSMVLDAAVEVFKKEGYDKITAKNVAKELGASIAPVYSVYVSMDDLKRDVAIRVGDGIEAYFLQKTAEQEAEAKCLNEGEQLLERMFRSLAKEDEHLREEIEARILSGGLREHPWQSFLDTMSYLEEHRKLKMSRREYLGLIARHKNYILHMFKKS